jgi:hypothetical protein
MTWTLVLALAAPALATVAARPPLRTVARLAMSAAILTDLRMLRLPVPP